MRDTLQLKHHEINAVIFDIDGTLVDTFSAYFSVFNKGIGRYKSGPVSKEFLIDCLKKGLNLGEMLREILPSYADESLIERCKKEILELFLKVETDEVRPFPGADELFRKLKDRGIKIGIATGRMSSPEYEWDIFRKFGLDKFVDTIVTTREVKVRKPAPDVIIECAKRLEIPIQECIIVGDTESDVIAAKKAGAISVVLTPEQEYDDSAEEKKPDFIFRSLYDLAIFLEEQGMK